MYKEIALDPQCMSEYHYYGLLKTCFGYEKGRYVIAPTFEWTKLAYESVKNSSMSPIKRKSVSNFLNKLRTTKSNDYILLPKGREIIDYNLFSNWSEWVLKQRDIKDLCIVSEREIANAINYDQIIDSHPLWKVSPTLLIQKTVPQIACAISGVIVFSNELYIIDQYFRLAGNKVLNEIFKMTQEFKEIKKIVLVTSIETKEPEIVFEREYINQFNYIPKFMLVVALPKYFHDRYIISDRAALKSGHGFSEDKNKGTQADLLSISFAGEAECKETKSWVYKAIQDGKATENILYPI